MNDLTENETAPGFDAPLDMLRACHERIMDQCATLHKLLQHLPTHGCDAQARQSAQAILSYFDKAGQSHHDDEENHLFPLLRAAHNDEADALIQRLLDEHHLMDAQWLRLHPQLQRIAEGQSTTLERSLVADFSLAYGRHIMLENMKLLPLAAQLLNEKQLHDMGKKMAARKRVLAIKNFFKVLNT